jgi:hypothetical protein
VIRILCSFTGWQILIEDIILWMLWLLIALYL